MIGHPCKDLSAIVYIWSLPQILTGRVENDQQWVFESFHVRNAESKIKSLNLCDI